MIRPRVLFLAGLSLLAQAPGPASGQGPNATGMEFVKIAPGEFVMGCSSDDSNCTADEKPAHRVRITKPFEIGKYEVTQAQWQVVMGSNPSAIKGENRPVESVSKDGAHDFVARLNARNDGYRYRLPTEAEWEYAARAGTSGPLAASLDDVAWYGDNSEDETHPVGTKKPNAWGIYDMLGNVREWVEDVYARYSDNGDVLVDPTGPQGRGGGPPDGNPPPGRGGRRFGPGGPKQFGPPRGGGFAKGGPGRQLPIVRGGAWDNPATFVRASARYHYYGPTLRVSDIGFRVVREPV